MHEFREEFHTSKINRNKARQDGKIADADLAHLIRAFRITSAGATGTHLILRFLVESTVLRLWLTYVAVSLS
jgi:hypothetical protein